MKIVCAVGGSRYSHSILEALQRVEMPSESSVELLHVIETDRLSLNKGMSSEAKQAIQKGLVLAQVRGEGLMSRAEETVSG